jgi:phage FluMu gp28-like protein
MQINYQRPFLTTYQQAILDAPERYTITAAATKCGKTASHIIWIFEQALQLKDNQSVWWIAPVYQQAEIAFRRMKSQVSEKDFFISNESKLTLILPNGARIEFKSGEKPDNLYGDDVYAAVVDEASRMREESWYALRSTLTATKGKCKMIGNVKGKKNWFYKLGERARLGEDDYKFFKITAYDAAKEGILDIEEIEQAKKDLPEFVFKELYLAEPGDDNSNPFGLDNIRKCYAPLSNGIPIAFGIDLAKYTDWTVITGLDNMNRVCYTERFQGDWMQTKQKIINVVGRIPAHIDATGVGDPIVEELQRLGSNVYGFKYSSQSKQQLMIGLQNAIQLGEVSIIEGIMQDEMESFEFEYTRTGVKYNAPVGMHDDTVNALALARNIWKKRGTGIYNIV